jgi:hypothetical protein
VSQRYTFTVGGFNDCQCSIQDAFKIFVGSPISLSFYWTSLINFDDRSGHLNHLKPGHTSPLDDDLLARITC